MLFFIEVDTQRIYLAGVAAHPAEQWVTQLARNFTLDLPEGSPAAKFLIRDRDTKSGVPLPRRSPPEGRFGSKADPAKDGPEGRDGPCPQASSGYPNGDRVAR